MENKIKLIIKIIIFSLIIIFPVILDIIIMIILIIALPFIWLFNEDCTIRNLFRELFDINTYKSLSVSATYHKFFK